MATFNPDPGGVPSPNMPDQTGASRGSAPDRSFGIALSGIGTAIKGTTDTIDSANKFSILGEVEKNWDSVNQTYSDTLPVDLKNGAADLSSLQNAYEQGKLSDVYYTGQLAAMSKQLRAKYSQYEKYVDDTIESVTGIRPANAYRNAIMDQFDKQTKQLEKQADFQQQWEKENEQFITQLVPDYFKNPGKYDFDTVRQQVSSIKASGAAVQAESNRIDLLAKQNKVTTDDAQKAAAGDLSQVASVTMTSFSNMLGVGGGDFLSRINKMETSGFSTKDYQALMANLGSAEATLRAKLNAEYMKPINPQDPKSNSFFQILGADQMKKDVDAAMSQFNVIKQYATDQNWGVVGYYARLNQLMLDSDTNAALNASPDLRTIDVLKNFDPNLTSAYWQAAGKQNSIYAEIAPAIAANIASGNDTLGASTERIMNTRKDAATKAGGLNALIDSDLETVTSGHATPDQVKSAVTGTYGIDKAGKDIFSYIDPKEYEGLYYKMYSPAVTKAILQSGDPNSIKTYFDSMVDKTYSIPSLRAAAKALENTNDFSSTSVVKFIPGVNKFTLETNPDSLKGPFPGGSTGAHVQQSFLNAKIQTAKSAIDSLNSAFANMQPLLDGMNIKPEDQTKVFSGIVDQLGVNLNSGRKDDFWATLGKAIQTGVTMAGQGLTGKPASGGGGWGKDNPAGLSTPDPRAKADTSAFDFIMPNTPENAKGDGSISWRTNNPGNLRAGDFSTAHGAVGNEKGFAVFRSYEDGQAAQRALLSTPAYQKLTLEGVINKYSPPSENDTGAYVAAVTADLGLPPDTQMSDLTPQQMDQLLTAIQSHEGFIPGKQKVSGAT